MIRKNGLIATYMRLKESGTPSDFPNVMLDVQHKLLIQAFRGMPSAYKTYAKLSDLTDFKTANRVFLGEAEDLLEVPVSGPYKGTKLSDYKYQIALSTFGRTFGLARQTVINDDLQAFRDVPEKLGRAAARTLAKKVCALLETNANAYDSSPMFGTRNSVSNNGLTNLTADATGVATLQAGLLAIATAKDPTNQEILGLQAKYLVVAPAMAEVAKWLLNSTALIGSTSSMQSNPLIRPALAQGLELVVEPFLTSFPNRFYLFADPNQCHALEVAYLNGVREPELFMADSNARRVSGGMDEFGYDYDDINYKVRWDFGVAVGMPQAIYKGGN